jgi:hypothetical protein
VSGLPDDRTPTLHLTVGLPGVGKTTLARKIAHEDKAVRFTPDEWMIPLFGTAWREPDADGKRDVLEGRQAFCRRRRGRPITGWAGRGWGLRHRTPS